VPLFPIGLIVLPIWLAVRLSRLDKMDSVLLLSQEHDMVPSESDSL